MISNDANGPWVCMLMLMMMTMMIKMKKKKKMMMIIEFGWLDSFFWGT